MTWLYNNTRNFDLTSLCKMKQIRVLPSVAIRVIYMQIVTFTFLTQHTYREVASPIQLSKVMQHGRMPASSGIVRSANAIFTWRLCVARRIREDVDRPN